MEKDVVHAVEMYPTVLARVDEAARQVSVGGTVPIEYQNARYNVPFTLWIPPEYPQTPPRVFLTPTEDMAFKPNHPHIASHGAVTIDYILQWKPVHSIAELLFHMSDTYSLDPPLYAKQPTPLPLPTPVPTSHPTLQPTPHPTSHPTPQPPPHHSHHYPAPTPSPAPPPFESESTPPPPFDHHDQKSELDAVQHSSLKSAVEEKLRFMLEGYFHQAELDVAQLNETRARFLEGRQAIEAHAGRLAHERDATRSAIELIERETQGAYAAINTELERPPFNPDTDVVPATSLQSQLLNAIAEDRAVEDTCYQLNRALQADCITLATFLKHTRLLFRRQFAARATINHIQNLLHP